MKVGIMQPYLFPYIGYFQLINAVGTFVILDNVQYINRGWINRNRILINGSDHLFTFSLKQDSRDKIISERYFSDEFNKEKEKFFLKIHGAYAKAPHYQECESLLKNCMEFKSTNVSDFIVYTLQILCSYMGINTNIVLASQILEKTSGGENYIIDLCRNLNAEMYINPIGGRELYSKENFKNNQIKLYFLKAQKIVYPQFSNQFVECLSILDVLMFNSKEETKLLLERYELT